MSWRGGGDDVVLKTTQKQNTHTQKTHKQDTGKMEIDRKHIAKLFL